MTALTSAKFLGALDFTPAGVMAVLGPNGGSIPLRACPELPSSEAVRCLVAVGTLLAGRMPDTELERRDGFAAAVSFYSLLRL